MMSDKQCPTLNRHPNLLTKLDLPMKPVLPDICKEDATVPESKNNKSEILDRHLGFLDGTMAENLILCPEWDNHSLGKDFPENIHTQLVSKLAFKNPAAESFEGTSFLETLETSESASKYKELPLLQALECFHLDFREEAESKLRDYIEVLKNNKADAHPLLILAISRLLHQSNLSKSQTILLEFHRIFPDASHWLTQDEKAIIKKADEPSPNDPRTAKLTIKEQWELLQQQENCTSKAMDELLEMTGLRKVKDTALTVFKTGIGFSKMSDKQKKKNQANIKLNYVFLGNPGTGKTTVARLFAQILHDSGLRSAPSFKEATAQDLKEAGASKFKDLIQSALGGVLFIDEAYDLDPAGDAKGKPIVAELLTASENLRDKVSFILAGYQDDMTSKFFSYNIGLRSRFEEVFFDDMDESQLKLTWESLIAAGGWSADPKIGHIVAKRLIKRAGKKGFGNAREVRNLFESAMKKAMGRENYDAANCVLEMKDVIGEWLGLDNPQLKDILKEIDGKIGWVKIKQSIQELLKIVELNYERELLGEPQLPIFLNRLFLGNPGTGKTTCATLYGKLLKQLNILSVGEVVLKTASDFVGQYVGSSAQKTNDILASAAGKVLVIDEAYNLNDNMYGKQVLDILVEKVQGTPSDDIVVLLLGYEKQMLDMIRSQNPGLARRFPQEYAFRFDDYTDTELRRILQNYFRDQNVVLSSQVARKALDLLKLQKNLPNFGNAGAVKLLVDNAFQKASARQSGAKGKIQILPEDIDSPDLKDPAADPLSKLDELYNVDNIRTKLQTIRTVAMVAKKEGREIPKVGHFIFTGAPGTGKTTVARIVSEILHEMGLIAAARTVETSGLNLTGDYVGQTKTKVTEQMEKAKGGVLFIDEAYKLGEGMYGDEALTTLLAGMTNDEYKGMVVIIAGYPTEIDTMLDRNAGLKSRFTKTFEFYNWKAEDCYKFFTQLAEKQKMQVAEQDSSQHSAILSKFKEISSLQGWGNARDVKQIFENAMEIRASAVHESTSIENIMHLEYLIKALDAIIHDRRPKNAAPHTRPSSQSESDCRTMSESVASKRSRKSERPRESVEEAAEKKEEESNEPEEQNRMFVRDEGVTDDQWEELEKAKQQELEKLRIMEENELKKAMELQDKVKKIGRCPAGYAWFKVSNGWRCGGGSHFVSDKQLEDHFTC